MSLIQVSVKAGQNPHGDSKFSWLQMPFVLTPEQAGDVSLDEAKKLVAASYKTSFQFKKLMLVVACWPWSAGNMFCGAVSMFRFGRLEVQRLLPNRSS
jgi:hypothetical protein